MEQIQDIKEAVELYNKELSNLIGNSSEWNEFPEWPSFSVILPFGLSNSINTNSTKIYYYMLKTKI